MKKLQRNLYFLGIDGGGSTCRARLISSEGSEEIVLGTGKAGPANPREGVESSIKAIMSSVNKALVTADMDSSILKNTIAGIGLAGIALPDRYHALTQWEHPFRKIFITSDQHIACLGAHNGSDGAIIITGTGSCGICITDSKTTEYGGHGFPLGDKGGGAWMGLKALQYGLQAENNLGPKTMLRDLIHDRFKTTDNTIIINKMVYNTPAEYAKLAHLVFTAAEMGDDVATDIIKDGAAYISQMARAMLKLNPPRLSILGGLSRALIPWLDKDIASHLKQPLDNAEAGAILYAWQCLARERQKT
ncbi:MAG: hypothetical protein K9G26_11485 [Emcibacter sp.]|nr:hypothetical protein [Emcibacter sp.]